STTEKSDSCRIAAYCGMIRSFGDRGLSLQTTALAGKSGPSQAAALQLVRESNVPGATQAYTKLLPKVSPSVQLALLDSLGQRDDASAAPAIAAMTRCSAPEIRVASLKALGPLGDGSVIPLLTEAAASGDSEQQATARQTLVTIHRGNPTAALLAQLETSVPAIQAEAARALGERSDSAAIPKLLEVAR